MQRIQTTRSELSTKPSLRDAISGLHLEFSQMREELKDAHREIRDLKRQLRSRPAAALPANPEKNLGSLRRLVSFYCHPDRGGDEMVMRRLNVLFDYLGRVDCASAVEALEGK